MKIIDVVSVCCNAEVTIPTKGITMYYICMECKKACDGKEDKSNGKKKR